MSIWFVVLVDAIGITLMLAILEIIAKVSNKNLPKRRRSRSWRKSKILGEV